MITKLEMQIEKGKNFIKNYVTENIIECMNYYNRESEKIIENNKIGVWGSEFTQKQANVLQADDFLLNLMLNDCKVFCNSDWAIKSGHLFECGRTRSHIWIHIDNERILMFYY